MQPLRIRNRNDTELAVAVAISDHPKGVAFVAHGLGGFKEQAHIRVIAEACQAAGYNVVTYDAANSLGQSGGRMQEATLTNYYEDLEDVIAWAATQSWYAGPLLIAGHSIGGACAVMYAANHPGTVAAIIPVCPMVAGSIYEARKANPKAMERWEKKGYLTVPSAKPGKLKRIGWNFAADLRTHDIRTVAPGVQCRSLFIAGSKDTELPPEDIQQLVDKVNGPVEFHVIQGMGHNPRSKKHLAELRQTIQAWL